MVVGKDVEKQLAPFHEFECTGQDDEFIQEVDITDEFLNLYKEYQEKGEEKPLQEALEYYGYDNRCVNDPDELDFAKEHKYGYVVIEDGEVVRVVKRTNPNAKWDWWVVGGRWSGFLKLKPEAGRGRYADEALKGEIDWEGMKDEAGQKASEEWDAVRTAVPDPWRSWEDVRGSWPGDLEAARIEYNSQVAIKTIRELDSFSYWGGEDKFLVSKEEYVQDARDRAISTFAYLKDDQWAERGEMGWFGVVTGEKDKKEWGMSFSEMIDSLPDDTPIAIVDCHI